MDRVKDTLKLVSQISFSKSEFSAGVNDTKLNYPASTVLDLLATGVQPKRARNEIRSNCSCSLPYFGQ